LSQLALSENFLNKYQQLKQTALPQAQLKTSVILTALLKFTLAPVFTHSYVCM